MTAVEKTETATETAAATVSETDEVQQTAEETDAVQTTSSADTTVTAAAATAATTTVTAIAPSTTTAENTTATTAEETEPPAPKIYNDGTFTGKAYGYDGYIYVTVTIENDMITSISSTCEEEDISYWLSCREKVISQITDSQQTQVDAVSGATYSSNAIMKAVAEALETAKTS